MSDEEVWLSAGVKFEGSNGGIIKMINTTDISKFGVSNGWAVYDDLSLNPYSDMTLDVSGSYGVSGSVQHLTGDQIVKFNLSSRSPNGTIDIRVENLKPEAWYRLQFDGVLAKTAGGRANGVTSKNGVIEFVEVEVPDS